MIKTRLRYCVYDPQRNGKPRYYVRKPGHPKVRIKAKFCDEQGNITTEFMAAYFEALASLDNAAPKQAPKEETFAWLWDRYQRSAEWAAYDEATRRDKKSVLGRFVAAVGNMPYKKFRTQDVKASQAKRAATPAAADKLVKYLRTWFGWAMSQTPALMESNPALGVKKIHRDKGFHTWTDEEVGQFREHFPIGTQARLALELMLQVGARRSDAARLGRQHERQGTLSFVAYKNRSKAPVQIDVPIRAELRAAMVPGIVGDMTYLVTERGASFTIAGFGNKFREWCNAAGLAHCSAHGLRKASATLLAESGASANELMAIFGWTKMETAEVYVRAANRKRMAATGIARLDERRANKSVSHPGPEKTGETIREKTPLKSKGE